MAPKKTGQRRLYAFSVVETGTNNTPLTICGSHNQLIPGNNFSLLGIDSHADVSCAGKDARILSHISGRKCEVKGFHDSYGSITDVRYVNVAYKYHDQDGQEYIIELNQALDFTKFFVKFYPVYQSS